MAKIDGAWIKQKIGGDRGSQARLADAIGMDKNKLSKVMSGVRALSADETLDVLIFFDVIRPEALDPLAEKSRIERLPPEVRKMVDKFVDSLLSDQEAAKRAQD